MSSLVSHCHIFPIYIQLKETPLILQNTITNKTSFLNYNINPYKNTFLITKRRKMALSMKHSSIILFFASTLFLQVALGMFT